MRPFNDQKEISLPDVIEFLVDYEEAYSDFFRGTSREVRLECYNQILFKWIEWIKRGHSISATLKERDILPEAEVIDLEKDEDKETFLKNIF